MERYFADVEFTASRDNIGIMNEKPAILAGITSQALTAFDYEAAGEAASSLGHAGNRVEIALAELRGCANGDPMRIERVSDAAIAVYHYFIQREIMGMRRHEGVIREYAIPGEVLARLGAIEPKNAR